MQATPNIYCNSAQYEAYNQDIADINEDSQEIEDVAPSMVPAAAAGPSMSQAEKMETSAQATRQFATADLFDNTLQQGRIAPPSWKDIMTHNLVKGVSFKPKDDRIFHQNGIFGSYCLEDVRCIANLVLQKSSDTFLVYDCFNYETTAEITKDAKVITSSNAPAIHIDMFWQNLGAMNAYAKTKQLAFKLHYADKRNDLLQKRKFEPKPDADWSKFKRVFSQNMIFFNPYFNNAAGTTDLIDEFFDYAETNLASDGIVTLMWNMAREDGLASIDIEQIAEKHHFKLIRRLDGRQFANLTGFRHLKNSSSLERAVSECVAKSDPMANSVIVSPKRTDGILMFKRHTRSRDIPKENVIATVLTSTLKTMK